MLYHAAANRRGQTKFRRRRCREYDERQQTPSDPLQNTWRRCTRDRPCAPAWTHDGPSFALLTALELRRRYAQDSSYRNRLTGAERDWDAAPATGRREHNGIGDNSTGDDDIRNSPRHLVSGSEVTHRNAGPPSNPRSKCKMPKPTTTTKNSVTQIQVLSSWTA